MIFYDFLMKHMKTHLFLKMCPSNVIVVQWWMENKFVLSRFRANGMCCPLFSRVTHFLMSWSLLDPQSPPSIPLLTPPRACNRARQ